MAMKGYSAFPKTLALMKPHHQVVFCRIQDTRWDSLTTLQRCCQYILPAPTNWSTGHWLGEFYPSAEMQSAYSRAPADSATGHWLGKSFLSTEIQSVYSTAPVDQVIWSFGFLYIFIVFLFFSFYFFSVLIFVWIWLIVFHLRDLLFKMNSL